MTVQTDVKTTTRTTFADQVAARGSAAAAGRPALYRKPRIGEAVVRYLLLACGLISVLTTVGIVVVLLNQSVPFFTTYGFSDSNHALLQPIDTATTLLTVSVEGRVVQVGDVVRIGEEFMRVTAVDGGLYTVERGVEGTSPADHPLNAPVYLGKRADMVTFLTTTIWQPQAGEFGLLPLLGATVVISLIAMVVAVPVGLGAAVYISEYASDRMRSTLKPILELLAGVPTVVFGYFALTAITPLLRAFFGIEVVGIYNMLSAGIVVGIMVIPTITSISEDAMSAVPRALREGSLALGATKLETIIRVLLPAALSGILAAFILGLSRAMGETMIVAIAAGAGPKFTANPFEAAETITGHIARISTGDLSFQSIDYNSIFALGLALFVLTLVLNLISQYVTARFREVYQ